MHDADRWYREHAPSLIRYLQRQLGDRDLAEDVVQETFLRALRHEPSTNARSWLFTTATNLVRDLARRDVRRRVHLERLQRDRVQELEDAVADHAAHPLSFTGATGDDAGEGRDESVGDSPMHRALESLSARDRTALLLSEEGLSYNEIAVMLELSMQSVGTTLTRARKRLIRQYELLVVTVAVQGDADAE
ncbi:MAG: sigma-70 family RNA polymerase sigma factor [Gemmatimonadaceae bacterium]